MREPTKKYQSPRELGSLSLSYSLRLLLNLLLLSIYILDAFRFGKRERTECSCETEREQQNESRPLYKPRDRKMIVIKVLDSYRSPSCSGCAPTSLLSLSRSLFTMKTIEIQHSQQFIEMGSSFPRSLSLPRKTG